MTSYLGRSHQVAGGPITGRNDQRVLWCPEVGRTGFQLPLPGWFISGWFQKEVELRTDLDTEYGLTDLKQEKMINWEVEVI